MHLTIAMLVSAAAMLMLGARSLRTLRLPVMVYLLSYTATTVVGASVILDEFGLQQFRSAFPAYNPEEFKIVGTPLYWILLLAPLFLVPAGARVGATLAQARICSRLLGLIPADGRLIAIFYAVVAAAASW